MTTSFSVVVLISPETLGRRKKENSVRTRAGDSDPLACVTGVRRAGRKDEQGKRGRNSKRARMFPRSDRLPPLLRPAKQVSDPLSLSLPPLFPIYMEVTTLKQRVCCLGRVISTDCGADKDISVRIGKARYTFRVLQPECLLLTTLFDESSIP